MRAYPNINGYGFGLGVAVRRQTGIALSTWSRWKRGITEPTLESAERIFKHRGINLLCVTGGPGVARAAMQQALPRLRALLPP